MSQSTTKRMSPKMASPSEARASTAIPGGRGGPGRSRRWSGARRGRPGGGGAAVAAGGLGAAPEASLLLRTGLRAAAAGAPRAAAAAFLSAQEAGRAGTSVTGPAPRPPPPDLGSVPLGPPWELRGRGGGGGRGQRVLRPVRPPGSGAGAAEALAPCRPTLVLAAEESAAPYPQRQGLGAAGYCADVAEHL